MNRLFTQHIRRQVQSLEGIWNFAIDPQDEGEVQNWEQSLPKSEKVTVPSVWNNNLGLLEYEGAAWYEKSFYTEGGCLRFVFDAVMTEADVWLDGQKLGYHYGGFTQFTFIVPEVEMGWHTLTVRADIRFNELSIPQEKTDWFHYGGITRSVRVEQLKGICVLYSRMEYTLSQDLSRAEGHFVLELYNGHRETCSSTVEVKLGDKLVYSQTHTLAAGEKQTVTTPTFGVDNPRLWDANDPQLYDICCSTDTDDLYDRTGFRCVEVRDGKFYLNNKPFYIKGVNRHEEHPDWGKAFPQGLMKRDLDIIRDLGCNSVRGSHYPNSKIFVDMLDESGLAFWSEIPMWGGGFSGAALTPEQKEMLRDSNTEHTLLINEEGAYELLPYRQLDKDPRISAFAFIRQDAQWLVYWHKTGEGQLWLPLSPEQVSCYQQLGDPLPLTATDGGVLLPLAGRHYLKTSLTADALQAIVKKAKIL